MSTIVLAALVVFVFGAYGMIWRHAGALDKHRRAIEKITEWSGLVNADLNTCLMADPDCPVCHGEGAQPQGTRSRAEAIANRYVSQVCACVRPPRGRS